MKKTLSLLAFLALTTIAAPMRNAQAESAAPSQDVIIATPLESHSVEMPDDGHSMFDRSHRAGDVADNAAPPKPTQTPNANGAKSDGANNSGNAAPPAKVDESASYAAIWRDLLGYPEAGVWKKTKTATASGATPAEEALGTSTLQSAQNARLIAQNDLLIKQNEQIIALLQQLTGTKDKTKTVTSANGATNQKG